MLSKTAVLQVHFLLFPTYLGQPGDMGGGGGSERFEFIYSIVS